MSDVARHAGVALGTVSNVLNAPEKVSEKTRERVHRAVAELGFVRNQVARTLAAGSADLFGFVIVDIGNSFFVDIARGAEQSAVQNHYKLLLANSDVDLVRQNLYLDLFNESQVSGILLAPLDAPLDAAVRVRDRGCPVVLVNWPGQDGVCCGVTVDEEYGGYLATRHLLEQGRRRILFAGGPFSLTAVRERYEGAKRAIAESQLDAHLELVETTRLTVPAGLDVGRSLVSRPAEEKPDGIFAAADALAAGCAQALIYGGVSVPKEIAIIGYDDNHFTADHVVPISTVGQPGHEMGKIALEMLIDEVKNPDHLHRTVVLQPNLLARASTMRDA